jgi:hypothetical protein
VSAERSARALVSGCYEITGTQVSLRSPNNINQILGSLNFPDQIQANGQTFNAYVQVGQKTHELHTFARVVVASGPLRDTNGWVAVEYLRPCSRPPMGEVAQRGALTAQQALVTSQRLQATQATQAGGRLPEAPPRLPQVAPLRAGAGATIDQTQTQPGEDDMSMQHYDDSAALMQFAAGLGANLSHPEGFGAIGNMGNTNVLPPGKYEVSGEGVNVRPAPKFSATPKSTLNTGDVVQATGDVESDASPGTDANFPFGVSVNFAHIIGPVDGWIAVGYLDKLGTNRARPGDGGGITAKPPTAMISAGKMDLTIPILIAAGVLGVGLVGYAVYRSKKGKARAA